MNTAEPDDTAAFTDDLTLKPHPNELKSAVNGDHVVRFSLKDYTLRACVDGEPADSEGDEWDATTADGDLRWTYVTVPAAVASALAAGDRDEYRETVNGAALRVRIVPGEQA